MRNIIHLPVFSGRPRVYSRGASTPSGIPSPPTRTIIPSRVLFLIVTSMRSLRAGCWVLGYEADNHDCAGGPMYAQRLLERRIFTVRIVWAIDLQSAIHSRFCRSVRGRRPPKINHKAILFQKCKHQDLKEQDERKRQKKRKTNN